MFTNVTHYQGNDLEGRGRGQVARSVDLCRWWERIESEWVSGGSCYAELLPPTFAGYVYALPQTADGLWESSDWEVKPKAKKQSHCVTFFVSVIKITSHVYTSAYEIKRSQSIMFEIRLLITLLQSKPATLAFVNVVQTGQF